MAPRFAGILYDAGSSAVFEAARYSAAKRMEVRFGRRQSVGGGQAVAAKIQSSLAASTVTAGESENVEVRTTSAFAFLQCSY